MKKIVILFFVLTIFAAAQAQHASCYEIICKETKEGILKLDGSVIVWQKEGEMIVLAFNCKGKQLFLLIGTQSHDFDDIYQDTKAKITFSLKKKDSLFLFTVMRGWFEYEKWYLAKTDFSDYELNWLRKHYGKK